MHVLNSGQNNSNIKKEPPDYRNNGIQTRLNRIERFYNSVEELYSSMNIKDDHKYHLRKAYRNLEGKKEDMKKEVKELTHLDLDVIMTELDSDVENAIKSIESAISSMKKKRLKKKAEKAYRLYKSIIDKENPGFTVSIGKELEDLGTNSYGKENTNGDI